MNLQTVFMLLGALVAGVVVGLKVIAPMTTTTVDDKVLEKLEALEAVLKSLTGTSVQK